MRIAIVHDYLTQRGGAERVVLALHRLFPSAPIFTSVFDPDGTLPELRGANIRTTHLQRLPHRGSAFRWLLPLYPFAFARLPLDAFDLVVSSSSGFAHGVSTPARHVVYCHNPPRWLYQGAAYFADGGPVPSWTRGALAPVLAAMRRWDLRVAHRPTSYIANSRVVADRIARCYGRRGRVVHPPVDVAQFGAIERAAPKHYLVVARLLPYKRVDLAIRACARRGAPLVVVGDGPARRELEQLGAGRVTFAGRVDDATLRGLYANARALIHAGEEDFGIVPLEAMAAGVPVVAYGAGGALETVVDGETGLLFDAQTDDALDAALDRFEARRWDEAALRAHAARFSEARFHERFVEAAFAKEAA